MAKEDLKVIAVEALKKYDNAKLIIEEISKCYQTVGNTPSNEEKFLINELKWFLNEL